MLVHVLYFVFPRMRSFSCWERDSVRTELKGLSSYGNASTAGDRQKLLVTVTQVKIYKNTVIFQEKQKYAAAEDYLNNE